MIPSNLTDLANWLKLGLYLGICFWDLDPPKGPYKAFSVFLQLVQLSFQLQLLSLLDLCSTGPIGSGIAEDPKSESKNSGLYACRLQAQGGK
jgi:hypothetical protein